MSTTLSRSLRRPLRAALALTVAVVGLAAITSTASATTTTLNTGVITLTDGSGTTDPPAGSWVHLPTDVSPPPPPLTTDYFDNTFSSTWGGTPSGKYTLIRASDSGLGSTGLELGTTQSETDVLAGNTRINGDDTDLFGGNPWFLFTDSAPELEFDDTTGQLVSGDLTGLKVSFGGGVYDVGTDETSGGKHTVPLTGSITGNPSIPGNATITLEWTSDLTEPGFNLWRAHFQLVGTYN